MDTVTTKTRCEVVDQILAWTRPDGTLQVEAGDLVVDGGEFKLLAEVVRLDRTLVQYSFDGEHGIEYAAVDELVAVRRYIETTEE